MSTESTKIRRVVNYKCPFCTKKMDKQKLVNHVDKYHEDELPEDFSPLRYVFHYVNKKPLSYHGICTECKGPTPWDENKGRYNRQCEKKACHDSYVAKFEENMRRKRGVTRISSTAEGQEKMLANRKISGKYKWSDGTEKTYTGKYELHALEFMDKVMHLNSEDVFCPGPILEYVYEGKKHLYITDFYYQPYDLVIEVKDGGDNPNKRNMPEYRGKQIAKEKFIINNTNFNYIRLTNNNLEQLLAVFMDLKMQLVDDTKERVIHVNEAVIHESIGSPNDVWYTDDITPESLQKLFREYLAAHSDINITGNVAVKLHSGEPGNQNFIKPDFWGSIINFVNGTVVECNTAYDSKRYTTDGHLKVIAAHGWDQFNYDIMDSDGEVELPVVNGKVLDTNIVGSHIQNYDSLIVLSHFKGHTMGGFGGALKNIAIGMASRNGKKKIHRIPQDKIVGDKDVKFEQNEFIDAMADAASTIVDNFKGRVIFVNVMKNLSVDCDCDGNAHKPCMNDIGIFISEDPVALDQACVDQIYNSNDSGKNQMIERIESRNGLRILETAESEGFGTRSYNLSNGKNGITESVIFNEKDILYNKEAFDNGDINLCFITGHSGSGKSTMAIGQEKENVDVSNMDFLQTPGDSFKNIEEMRKECEYCSDLIYQFFKGPGKKYFVGIEDIKDIPGTEYEDKVFVEFVDFAKKYAKSHKNKKFICEGIYFFLNKSDNSGEMVFKPQWFDDYAFYIKGTSTLVSKFRAAKRDSKDDWDKLRPNSDDKKTKGFKRVASFFRGFFRKNSWKWYMCDEKNLKVFRDYFKNKPETVLESYIEEASKYNGKILYHVSEDNLNDKTLQPKVPDNYMTKNGYEDSETARVCFSTSVQGCLMALSRKCNDMELYVHIPDDISKYEVLSPNQSEVPDSKITKEKWICSPVKVKCIGKIRVTGDAGEDGIPYSYGDKEAELYKWNYEWIERCDSVNESVSISNYKILDIKSNKSKVLEYLKNNSETSGYAKDIVDNYNGEIIIADDTMIGRIFIGDKKDKGFITDFSIDEEYRGNGLGNRLLDDAINKYDGYDLLVDKNNDIAINMYKKKGFVIYKTVKNQYWMKLESDNIQESLDMEDYYPIFICISSYNSLLKKAILKFTHSEFTHACISFDDTFQKMYSFNGDRNKSMVNKLLGGISVESIEKYKRLNPYGVFRVFTLFLKEKDYLVLKDKIDYLEKHKDNTSYNLLGLLKVALNIKSKSSDSKMFCSEFVDSLFKLIDVDLTGKPSSLVSPGDLANMRNKKVYKLYDGAIEKFRPKKIANMMNNLINTADYIKESNEFEFIDESSNYFFDEAMNALLTGYVPGINSRGSVMVAAPNMQNTVFASNPNDDFWIIKNNRFDEIIRRNEDGILTRESCTFSAEELSKMNIYRVNNADYNRISNIVSENLDKEVNKDFLYETVFGHKCVSISDITFENVVEEMSYYEYMIYYKNAVKNMITEGTIYSSTRFPEYDRKNVGIAEQVEYLDGTMSIMSNNGIKLTKDGEFTENAYKFLKCMEE